MKCRVGSGYCSCQAIDLAHCPELKHLRETFPPGHYTAHLSNDGLSLRCHTPAGYDIRWVWRMTYHSTGRDRAEMGIGDGFRPDMSGQWDLDVSRAHGGIANPPFTPAEVVEMANAGVEIDN